MPEDMSTMKVVGDLNQHLRWHATDASAGRAEDTVVDDDVAVRVPSDLAPGAEPRSPRADDRDVHAFHDLGASFSAK